MLIRFVVSNFLSFNEETEFSMIAGPYKTHKHHVVKIGDINVLKTSAIYGTNGAGKSNFVKALNFLIETIRNGGIAESANSKKFKLCKEKEEKPITFELEFSLKRKTYAYGVALDNFSIIEEWLYETSSTKNSKMIFERKFLKGRTLIKFAEKYLKTEKQKLLIELFEDNLLKQSEVLIGKYQELQLPDITSVNTYLSQHLITIFPGSRVRDIVPKLTSYKEFREFSNKLIKSFDTGVTELGIETLDFDKYFGEIDESVKADLVEKLQNGLPEVPIRHNNIQLAVAYDNQKLVVRKIVAKHLIEDTEIILNLEEESDGTRRLLDIIPVFFVLLLTDKTYIIDEIDQSLHPALLKTLIKKLLENPDLKGQLIFTTHESNLLDFEIFRPDEIWFTEKDKNAQTRMYSLSDFKPRYDLDIRKGYLKGRFGAIPFLANLEELSW